MIGPVLARLLDRRPLTPPEVRRTFDVLVAARSNDAVRVAVLVGLIARPPSVAELAEFAQEMRRRAVPFPVPAGDRPLDLCGSGGARTPSFNVSTVSAFVVAAAGVAVVKHGNRSSRGPCGSSDLLEALGLPVIESREFARATYRAYRLAFLHAPLYHPATRAVVPARKALGLPTVFNELGPLSNPARISYQLVGVGDPVAAARAAAVLSHLGRERAVSVTSSEGCDEFSPQHSTYVFEQAGGRVVRTIVYARDLLEADDRRGAWGPLPPRDAANEARRILAGGGGARRGAVLLTAGAGLWVAGSAPNLAEGVGRAREVLDSGKAEDLLDNVSTVSSRFRQEGAR